VALVVVIDGDRFKMQQRLRQFAQQLTKEGLAARGHDEMIAICVPTRNIETWELWLCGDREVDEERDFKRRFREAEQRGEASARKAAEAWFQRLSPKEETNERRTLPSLAEGREEVRRLDGVGS